MSLEEESSAAASSPTVIFERLRQYNWDADADFQSGLSSILPRGQSQEQENLRETIDRAKCFYFSRKFDIAVDYDAYSRWTADGGKDRIGTSNASTLNGTSTGTTEKDSQDGSATELQPIQFPNMSSSAEAGAGPSGQAPYPTSFAHIVELISTGQPIPGIKEIPNTILEGQSSQTSARARRKPWEKDEETGASAASSAALPSSMTTS